MEADLWVMVGAPGSGKSTWAHRFGNPDIYVSRDEIRFAMMESGGHYFGNEDATWQEFIDRIYENIRLYNECIVDATHLNHKSRMKLLNALDARGLRDTYNTYFVMLDTPIEECKRRNNLRTGRARIPESAIDEMYAKLTIPTLDEHPSVRGVWIVKGEI